MNSHHREGSDKHGINQTQFSLKDYLEIKFAGGASPNFDSSLIVYEANVSGTYQLYLASTDGKDSSIESHIQITDFPESIDGAYFHHDRNDIFFSKDSHGDEINQIYIYRLNDDFNFYEYKKSGKAPGTLITFSQDPKVKYKKGAISRDGRYFSYGSNERNGKDFDIFIHDLQASDTEPENKEERWKQCVYDKGGAANPKGFSKTDRYVTVTVHSSNVNNDVYIIDRQNNNALIHLTPHEGDIVFGPRVWMQDDSGFYFTTNADRDFIGLAYYDLASRSYSYIWNPKWDIDEISGSRDGRFITLGLNEDGYSKIWLLYENELRKRIGIKNTEYGIEAFDCLLLNLKGIDVTGCTFSPDSKQIICQTRDAIHNSCTSICVLPDKSMNGEDGEDSSIVTFSAEFGQNNKTLIVSPQPIPSETMVYPELIRFKSFDGLEVPAFVFKSKDDPKENSEQASDKAADRQAHDQKRKPVLINIHGGPEAQYQPGFTPLTQYYVQAGFTVIAPNVRGSSGYGKHYLSLDDVEKRLDSVRDIVALYEYIKTQPDLDVDKVFLMGGSYGGYMVLACMAFYPEYWAGGIDVVGIANFVTFLENTASYRRHLREAEYGSLEKDRELLEKISPINHVDKIKAPLMVVHGTNDPRVPIGEARQISERLQELGREVELLVYDDEGHGISKLKNRLDMYPRVVEFLTRHL